MKHIREILPLWLEQKYDIWNNGLIKICPQDFALIYKNPKYSIKQWNNVKYCSNKCSAKARGIGTKKGTRGKDHPSWKGNNISYSAIHKYLVNQYGHPEICVACGKIENIDWAKITDKYTRNPDDYIGLCRKCHLIFDKNNLPELRRQSRYFYNRWSKKWEIKKKYLKPHEKQQN